MKFRIISSLLLTLSLTAFANSNIPRIDAPEELSGGDFQEGTITQISESEIAEFLPWAQNAQNQLNRALNTARSMPLRDRLPHIERVVKSVVSRSGDRQYQMFMRFSLNRGLMLVREMSHTMDMNEIGAQENALDILQRSIQVALNFYESDLSFQNRSQNGHSSTTLSYARFGLSLKDNLLSGVINVLDAKAQYRLMYKLVEMTNWDISRDAHANNYADSIVEAYELLQDLPTEPLQDDRANLRLIRRLNALKLLSLAAPSSNIRQGGNGTSVSTGVSSSNIIKLNMPQIDGVLFSSTAPEAGICRALGYENGIPGSAERRDNIQSRALEVTSEGVPVKMVPVNSSTGFYVSAVTCAGVRSQSRALDAVRIEIPRLNDMLYSANSDANGVCISQGFRGGVPGYEHADNVNTTALVMNGKGEVLRAEPVNSSTGFYITKVVCFR